MKEKIVIIGAGAAGIGMGILLQKMGLDFLILEQGVVGQSFLDWPPGTRFISPSFTGNFFGSPDLNAVSPDTSPAYMLNTEHPSGKDYANYLQDVAAFYGLPISEETRATSIKKEGDIFTVIANDQEIQADVVVWAGGEYQFPRTKVCEGHDLAVHNTYIKDWEGLKGDTFPILGGYESAFDTAIALARLGKKSVVFDSENNLLEERSDSSFSLSPFTKDRIKQFAEFITVRAHSRVSKIEKKGGAYVLTTEGGDEFDFEARPILATGFETSLVQVKDFFEWQDGSPRLTEHDESTKVKGFFLVGPQVRHENTIFCFVYKFRQRFGVVAEKIIQQLGMSDDEQANAAIDNYKQKNFYLSDLSCCGDECIC